MAEAGGGQRQREYTWGIMHSNLLVLLEELMLKDEWCELEFEVRDARRVLWARGGFKGAEGVQLGGTVLEWGSGENGTQAAGVETW